MTPDDIPIFIDGGDPIGTTPGDAIVVNGLGNGVSHEAGPESDEGGIVVGTLGRVSFDHIEAAGAFNVCAGLIHGTNGDNDITVLAQDTLPSSGRIQGLVANVGGLGTVDGVQDFSVTVDGNVPFFFIDTPAVFIDAFAGDDAFFS